MDTNMGNAVFAGIKYLGKYVIVNELRKKCETCKPPWRGSACVKCLREWLPRAEKTAFRKYAIQEQVKGLDRLIDKRIFGPMDLHRQEYITLQAQIDALNKEIGGQR